MTHNVCQENFGKAHQVVQASLTGPWAELTDKDFEEIHQELNLEMVRDFERIEGGYII
jgi:hypothetical protein